MLWTWTVACFVSIAPPPDAGTDPVDAVVDRVVASIEGQVLTLSELDFEARIALVERGGLQAAFAPLDDEILAGALELSIDQRLQNLEAEKLQAFPLEAGELEATLAAFERKFDGPAGLDRFLESQEADRQQLAALFSRQL